MGRKERRQSEREYKKFAKASARLRAEIAELALKNLQRYEKVPHDMLKDYNEMLEKIKKEEEKYGKASEESQRTE